MSYFNKQASEWDSPEKIQMMALLAEKTRDVLGLDEPLDVMDFGCGTGLFGLEFLDHAKSLLGVDTSKGMLEAFNKKIEGARHIDSILMDLETQSLNQKFDLIVSAMAFHHLVQPAKMIQTLRDLLRSKGRLAIIDLDHEDGSFHPDPKQMGVHHHGFSESEVQQWAKDAKMKLNYRIINTIHKNDKGYKQFLAVFSKA